MESLFRGRDLEYQSNYSLDELVKRMRELNHITKEVQESQSIAVVGNSGKLLTEEQGEFIDSHDIVFRCNLAKTEGYEKNVGTKTDFRFIAAGISEIFRKFHGLRPMAGQLEFPKYVGNSTVIC